ncbi:hypothetical protein AMJ87_13895 [candidate division WOR_3 bacterium SM23_60]|uniref:Uncharacterized protein n=1 Tax=candidate division WOR_3 bacterium SM23_60 TaxID=1703780 RepID=A0A0S8G2A4_UNCW3|nr:MAG: hypothetical protein AMJ87_13895 [candidate division WOR_3 bacterium SM23_60]
MKRLAFGTLIFVLLPVLANAATAFVWNFDPLDRFYDPEIEDSIDCSYWLERTLIEQGHTVDADINLPGDLNSYDVVFVTTGWFRC